MITVRTSRLRAAILLAGLLLSVLPRAAYPAETELLANGDFERGAAPALPEGWTLNGVGSAEISTDAHAGKQALRVAFGKEMTACYATGISVRHGVEYHGSYWAKGAGAAQLTIYQYAEGGRFLGSKFLETRAVSQDWQQFREVYTPPDEYVTSVAFALHVVGDGAWAIFDDASLTFDAVRFPPPKVEAPITDLDLRVEARDATATLTLDGAPVAAGPIRLSEGAHVLGVAAQATGPTPGVRVLCPKHPYLQTAFSASVTPGDGWQKLAYDETAWTKPTVGADGWMWTTGAERSVACRQIVGYARTPVGPQRCVFPRVKQWEWPQGAMQVLSLWLRPLDEKAYGAKWAAPGEFHFLLDIPKPFRMLETSTRCVNWFDIITPAKVTATDLTRNGVAYTRYDLVYPRNFHAERPDGCHTAVCLKPDGPVTAREVTFYYRRVPTPDQTELEVSLPVRMLPAVAGRMPKQIIMWSPMPVIEDTSGISSHEEGLEIARLHAAMGMNIWSARPDPYPRSAERKQRYDESLKEFQRLGGRYAIWLWNSLGLNYGFADYFAPGPAQYLKDHPEIQARWYLGQNPQTSGPGHYTYCNEWAGSDASAPFWDEIQKTYAMSLVAWPKPEFLFFDWEYARIDQQGRGNHCFCDRCKAAFRAFANLPAAAPLDDETIVKKTPAQWSQFRCFQDARIYAQIKKRCNALGQKMMLYVAGGDIDPVRYAKGCLDILHEGTPGNGYALSKDLEGLTKHFDETRVILGGVPLLPQMLPSFPGNGLNTEPSLDGYYHPKLLAVTNLVGVLASRGTGMEHWLVPSAYTAGAPYYVGESIRLLADCEGLFTEGKRRDELAASNTACGQVVVLEGGRERLILAFNDGAADQRVTLTQKDVPPGAKARLYFEGKLLPDPTTVQVTIPAEYLVAIRVTW